jgi:hypothetical protein
VPYLLGKANEVLPTLAMKCAVLHLILQRACLLVRLFGYCTSQYGVACAELQLEDGDIICIQKQIPEIDRHKYQFSEVEAFLTSVLTRVPLD